jgi:hypothetical protein
LKTTKVWGFTDSEDKIKSWMGEHENIEKKARRKRGLKFIQRQLEVKEKDNRRK